MWVFQLSKTKSNVVLFYQTYTKYWPKSAELCDFQNRKPGIIAQCTTRVRDFGITLEISDIQGSKRFLDERIKF